MPESNISSILIQSNLSQYKENKTLCSKVDPVKSNSLFNKEVLIEERGTGRRLKGIVIDICGEGHTGFIVRLAKKDVKGIIKKYKMGEAATLNGRIIPDHVEVDVRGHHQGNEFYLVENEKKSTIFFTPTNFTQLSKGQFILVLSKNIHGTMELRGVDCVVEVKKDEYTYKPISDWNKTFNLTKDYADSFELFLFNGGNYEDCSKFMGAVKSNVSILSQYVEDFGEMFSLTKDEVYLIVSTQLKNGASFLSFMALFEKNSRAINNIHFKINKVQEYNQVKSAFLHIFNPLG